MDGPLLSLSIAEHPSKPPTDTVYMSMFIYYTMVSAVC